MEKAYTINKPVYSFFYLCILFFTVGLNITDFSPGWVQQNPPIGNRFVTDIKFLDSLSGWAVTDQGSAPDSAFILKTSDGGNNWIIQYRLQVGIFHALSMVNISTGYACGISSIGLVMKTTNGGLNWTDLNFPGIQEFIDIDFINKDTGWVCDQTPLGGLWRTTNGGFSWDVEATVEVNNVFFVNDTTGWFTRTGNQNQLYKTTNTGTNWNLQYGFGTPIGDLFFIDINTGWVTGGGGGTGIMKTTDGGNNWFSQNNPTSFSTGKYYFNNHSLGWLGAVFQKIIATTNGGNNWGTQTTPIFNSYSINFVDTLIGGASGSGIIHTNDGGGLISYNAIKPISKDIPKDYRLFQNYPNPFNSSTRIKFQLPKDGHTNITVFDITGKVVSVPLNDELPAGIYEIQFNSGNISSGVYFYRLRVDPSASSGQAIVYTKKMIILK